ncbi:U1 zinc finger protein [Cryptosporidium felis]|nr:U1 zinc finger protein [Cryptosporidium felis]
MPKFYCDYCDIYLTHSSTNGRKQHNLGRRHINNKIDHYKNVIKSPGFSAPLMFDSEYNVIGHLGNVKQFIQNNEKQSNSEKKFINNNEHKDKDTNRSSFKSNRQFSNVGGAHNHGQNSSGGGNSQGGPARSHFGRNYNIGNSGPYSNYGKSEHVNNSNINHNRNYGHKTNEGDPGSRNFRKGHSQPYHGNIARH